MLITNSSVDKEAKKLNRRKSQESKINLHTLINCVNYSKTTTMKIILFLFRILKI